jgi:hypothetical protein
MEGKMAGRMPKMVLESRPRNVFILCDATGLCCQLNRQRKKSFLSLRDVSTGAKAPAHLEQLSARLKSRPDTKPTQMPVFRQAVKPAGV